MKIVRTIFILDISNFQGLLEKAPDTYVVVQPDGLGAVEIPTELIVMGK